MTAFALIIAGIILMALLETPLFTVIAGLSLACLYAADPDPLAVQTVLIELNRLNAMPVLTALPLFTFLGCLLTQTAAPRRVVGFLQALTGRLPGGIGVAAVIACAFFTALTGASGVTIVALGGVLYPALRQAAYPQRFTLGLLTTSGSLGLLFPPSLAVILYAVVAQVDIGRLFRAALMPGVLLIVVLAFYITICRVRAERTRPSVSRRGAWDWRRVLGAFGESIWEWLLLAIILVGIYGGFATVVETSAIAAAYAIVVECAILKEVHPWRQLPGIIVESAVVSGAIMVILGFALGFTGYLVDEQIPGRILGLLSDLIPNRYLFLAALNLFLLAIGCVMDVFSAIVIIVPVMIPIALSYGIDPIHLGVIFLINLEIGYATPPVGMNLFIASMKFEKPVTVLYRASIPYLLLLLLVLMAITYLPVISLLGVR